MENSLRLSEPYEDTEIIPIIRSIRAPRVEIPAGNRVFLIGRSHEIINEIFLRKKSWIERKVGQLRKLELSAKVPVGTIYFFGRKIGKKDFESNSVYEISRSFRSSLKLHAESFLSRITEKPPKIRIWRMRSKLGCYSRLRDEMHLSVYLAVMPKKLIEYSAYHEFVHRVLPRHDENFFRKVRNRYPDCVELEKELNVWWLRAKNLIKNSPVFRKI